MDNLSMFTLLNNSNKFGRIHHGFLNEIDHMRALKTHCNRYPEFFEIAEGDLCWLQDGKQISLFMMHPYSLNRLPDKRTILKNIGQNKISTLSDILVDEFEELGLIIELKSGFGNMYRVFEKLIDLLESKAKGRYWIDTFSPKQLSIIKEISPEVPTSLHTRLGVYGRYAIKTVFEFPYLGNLNLYNLKQADAITVTYKYSPARFTKCFGYTIDECHKHIYKSDKKLILGGIIYDKSFNEAKDSKAIAAYLKFDKHLFQIPYGN